jgi:hypothetical protein
MMKLDSYLLTAALGLALMAAKPGISASLPDITGSPQMVVTVLPGTGGIRPDNLGPDEISVQLNKVPAHIAHLQRFSGELADMQLFVLLDDSSRSGSLGTHLAELKTFLNALPPTTQVAVGYMRNGTFSLTQDFTTDHQKAAASLRLPMAMAGANGSPYFALSDLVKRWPSAEPTNRRAVLMLTDGVDRYYTSADLDDPYMDAAIHSALKHGVMVYSIYLSGAGMYDRRGGPRLIGQSHLIEVGEETGGFAYFLDYRDPVTIAPFLDDLRGRLDNQYQVTFGPVSEKGFATSKVHTESKSLKVSAPTRVYVP